jgi:hypothetical protein
MKAALRMLAGKYNCAMFFRRRLSLAAVVAARLVSRPSPFVVGCWPARFPSSSASFSLGLFYPGCPSLCPLSKEMWPQGPLELVLRRDSTSCQIFSRASLGGFLTRAQNALMDQ